MTSNELPADVQELVTKLFQLARDPEGAEELAQYVDAGVEVNLTNEEGNSLLMLAAYNGNEPGVRVLLERGADVNQCNDRNLSPVAGVIFKKEHEIARLLIKAGADLDAGSPSARETAMMFGINLADFEA